MIRENLGFKGRYRFIHQRGLIVGAHYAGPRTIGEMESEPVVQLVTLASDEPWDNLITNQGLQGLFDATIALNTGLFIDLIGASPSIVAGDTAASHAGWTFFANYSETARQAWTTTRTNQTRSNSASLASFTINGAGGNVGGACVFSNNTKGGTSGVLFSAGARSGGNLPVVAADIVRVQYDLTGASA